MIEYRNALPGDAIAISDIHARNFSINNKQGLTRSLSDEFLALWTDRLGKAPSNQHVLVAEENEALLGFICVYGREHARWGSLIDNLHVSASARQKGIGSALINQAVGWLITFAERDPVYLTVLESNTAAKSLYERLGGECVETFEAENHAGTRLMNCRYTWISPRHIAFQPITR